MEELLPLIIGILWLVYTFYTRGQKKKSARRPVNEENQPSKGPSFLEQLLAGQGIQLEDEEDPALYVEEEPIFEEQVTRARDTKAKPFLRTELSGYTGEGQSQFSATYQKDQKEMDEIYGLPFEFNQNMEPFDLKKAVVFSAILDAPYIDYK